MNKHKTMKECAAHEMPRERFLALGGVSLKDAELLAIILKTGTPKHNVMELAQLILDHFDGNLHALCNLTPKELSNKFNGVGETKAVTLLAAIELGRRHRMIEAPPPDKVCDARSAFMVMEPHLSHKQVEEFWVLYLNRANKVIDKVCISRGGVSASVVDVKVILRHAIEYLASGVIMCHNHPSGNSSPSEQDKSVTRLVKMGCEAIDVKLLDHIIVAGPSTYFSFADEGWI